MNLQRIRAEVREAVGAAFRALQANFLRTTLTTLGIVVGVTAVITIVSLIQGLDRTFSSSLSDLGTNVVYVNKYPWIIQMDFWKFRNRRDITLEQAERLAAEARIPQAVSYSAGSSGTVKWQERSVPNASIRGTTPAAQITASLELESGRFFTDLEVTDRQQVIVLGHGLWQELFGERDPLGKRVRVSGHAFTVIGVLIERGSILGQNQDLESYIPLETLLKLFGSRRSLQVALLAPGPAQMAPMEDEVRGILRRIRQVPPGAEDDFALNRQEMLLDLFRSLTAGLFAVLIGVSGLSLLVGGIGIMNIMLVSVTERTREIGIRKSVGAKRRDVLLQFLIESVAVSGLGGVIGMLLGLGSATLIAALTPLPAAAPLWAVILGLGFSISVGLFFGLYPAAKAARLDPIEALRFE